MSKDTPPTLILHGTADATVDRDQATELAAKLSDKIAAMQSFVGAGLQSGVGIRSKDELFADAMARASKS